jgi:digeranylgeranylglycerophospholipid reductase
MKDFDVIIIGAGPGGSIAAQTVAKNGWDVALLEKDEIPGKNNVCGGMLSLGTVEKFRIEKDIIEKTLHRQINVFPYGMVEGIQFPQVTVLRRRFDEYLADRAVLVGAKLFTKTNAADVRLLQPGQVEIEIVKKDSTAKEAIRGKIVIFADGVYTLARRFGQLGFENKPNNTAFALAYELEWPQNPMDHFTIYFSPEIARWGYAWIFPKRNILNVGMGCMLSELNRNKNLHHRLEYFIDTSELLRNKNIIRKRGAFIPMSPARRIYGDSALVVGDAAGMVHPLIGSGIDNAMNAGELAGLISNQALEQTDFSGKFLSKYQTEWGNNPIYKFIKRQDFVTKVCLPFSRIDKNISAKLRQLLFLRNEINNIQRIKVLAYPLLGKPQL